MSNKRKSFSGGTNRESKTSAETQLAKPEVTAIAVQGVVKPGVIKPAVAVSGDVIKPASDSLKSAPPATTHKRVGSTMEGVSKPGANIRFVSGWDQVVQGNLIAGNKITIEYDPSRAQLRHSRSGAPAWGVQAYVKMRPSGDVVEHAAVDFEVHKGLQTNNPKTVPITLEIPHGTTEIEVWFKNWAKTEQPQEKWDSNFGNNYRFSVETEFFKNIL